MRTDDLILLAQLVKAGSFTAASRATGIPKSRLSRRLSELEQGFGIRLIERSSRAFRVTELGIQLSRFGDTILGESEAALAFVQNSIAEPRGSLCIGCPVILAELVLGQVATSFAQRNPQVELTFDATSGMPNVELDAYDLLFRASPSGLPDSDLVARQLMVTPYELVATPEWIEQGGNPQSAADLAGKRGIGWWQVGAAPKWHMRSRDGAEHNIQIEPHFQTNNLAVARLAALDGLGMVRLPRPLCRDDIESGRLRRVIADLAPDPMAIYVVYPTRRSLTPAGRAFLEDVEKALLQFRRDDEQFWSRVG